MKGRFVVIDGLDKVGKTTLLNRLKVEYPDAIFVNDPSKEYAKSIREILLNTPGLENQTKAALYIAARKELMEKAILPALNQGKMVISDRFWASTYAYQCIVKEDEKESWYKKSHDIAILHHMLGVTVQPDAEIILLNIWPFGQISVEDVMDEYCLKHRQEITRNYQRYIDCICKWPVNELWVDDLTEEAVFKHVDAFIKDCEIKAKQSA